MPTDFEKIAADLASGKESPELQGKSSELKKLAETQDAQRVRGMLGNGEAVKKAVASGDTAALESIVRNVLSTREGARLAEEIAKMFGK